MMLRLMFAVLSMMWQEAASGGESSGDDPPAADDGKTGDDPGKKDGASDAPAFTQSDVDRILRDRLARERTTIRAEIKAELDNEREKESLKEREEYKPLYEQSQAELETYKSLEADLARMTEVLEGAYTAQLELLPEATKKIAKGLESKFDVVERLQWITELPDELKAPRVKGIPDTNTSGEENTTQSLAAGYLSKAYGKRNSRS